MHRLIQLLKRYRHYRQYQKLLKYRKYSRYGADFRSIARIKEYIKDRIYLIVLRVFYIFPIKKNRVMFMSFEAGKYACNPLPALRMIWQKIIRRCRDHLGI